MYVSSPGGIVELHNCKRWSIRLVRTWDSMIDESGERKSKSLRNDHIN